MAEITVRGMDHRHACAFIRAAGWVPAYPAYPLGDIPDTMIVLWKQPEGKRGFAWGSAVEEIFRQREARQGNFISDLFEGASK